jgi:VCBS repeat protein
MLLLIPPAAAEVPPGAFGSGIGRFNSVWVEDVDGDGRTEIMVGSYEGHVVSMEHRSGGYHVDWTSDKYATRAWGLCAGQFDDDDAREIIIGDGAGVVRALDGETKEVEWTSTGLVRDAHGLRLHDLDGDGDNELLVGTGFKTDQGWGQIYCFEQGESDPYDKFEPFDSRLRELDIADVDGDGEDELVVSCGVSLGDIPGEGYVRVFDLATKELEWKSPDLGGCVEGLLVHDLDGDGRPEIVASTGYRYREGYIYIYTFENDGYRRVHRSENVGPKAFGLDIGDIDGDGVEEIVVGNLDGYVHVFDGETFVREWRSGELGRDLLGIRIGDPDDDGELEIVVAQGGYVGKGDYTSGYTSPHVYVIDGRTKAIEAVLGEVDAAVQWLQLGVIAGIVVLLIELAVLGRMAVRWRRRTGGG